VHETDGTIETCDDRMDVQVSRVGAPFRIKLRTHILLKYRYNFSHSILESANVSEVATRADSIIARALVQDIAEAPAIYRDEPDVQKRDRNEIEANAVCQKRGVCAEAHHAQQQHTAHIKGRKHQAAGQITDEIEFAHGYHPFATERLRMVGRHFNKAAT
jgi:hypothetical protein